jgi:hypothetical protein
MRCENIQWPRRSYIPHILKNELVLFFRNVGIVEDYMRSPKKGKNVHFYLDVCSSWRLHDFECLFHLRESFTWEDQPTRDPHTGQRTLAGWIPHLQKVMTYSFAFTASHHLVQSRVRMYVSHELIYSAWYRFHTFSSPGYELAILMQVIPYLYSLYFYCNHLPMEAVELKKEKS